MVVLHENALKFWEKTIKNIEKSILLNGTALITKSKTMNKSIPRISILMSVYNGIPYLQESIESVLNQSFTNFEFIIIDDCSTDNTWDILRKYAKKDSRIKLYKNRENLGLTKSLNKGLNLATGEYIARQDADDISLPKRLEKQVELLNFHPDYILASCDIELIDAKGSTIAIDRRSCKPGLVAWYLLFYNHIAGHSQVMFRKEPVINLGGYLSTRRYSQDYELWCRLAKVGKMAILPEILIKQRRHSKSISADKKSEQNVYSLNQVRHNIKLLIEEEITIEEADALRKFWFANWLSPVFPNSRKAANLHLRLTQIYKAFLEQNNRSNLICSDLSSEIYQLVGKQFIYWVQTPIRNHHSLLGKILVSRYALAWHPLGLPKSWLISLLWRSPPTIFHALVKRLNRLAISQANF